MWKQLVEPNTSITMPAGWCLGLVQRVYGAPGLYNTAWQAWQATQEKHYSKDMPNVSVPVWFDHWGTYSGVYGQFGHVVAWVPGRGFLSSPGSGVGQKWLSSISEIERYYNCKYVGWTSDINSVVVAEEVITPEEKVIMSSNQSAAIVRNYELDMKDGQVAIALIYPNGLAVKLNNTMDVDALCISHIAVYGLPITNDKNDSWRTRYGAQLTTREFDAFFKNYPMKKKGF